MFQVLGTKLQLDHLSLYVPGYTTPLMMYDPSQFGPRTPELVSFVLELIFLRTRLPSLNLIFLTFELKYLSDRRLYEVIQVHPGRVFLLVGQVRIARVQSSLLDCRCRALGREH